MICIDYSQHSQELFVVPEPLLSLAKVLIQSISFTVIYLHLLTERHKLN